MPCSNQTCTVHIFLPFRNRYIYVLSVYYFNDSTRPPMTSSTTCDIMPGPSSWRHVMAFYLINLLVNFKSTRRSCMESKCFQQRTLILPPQKMLSLASPQQQIPGHSSLTHSPYVRQLIHVTLPSPLLLSSPPFGFWEKPRVISKRYKYHQTPKTSP